MEKLTDRSPRTPPAKKAKVLLAFVKILHGKGLCDYDYGSTAEMLRSGYQCECWEYAKALISVLQRSKP